MGDLHFWATSSFAQSLHTYAPEQGLPWYVAARLPIRFHWTGVARKKQLAPDTMVAFVPDHPRMSYDLEREGSFPPFVLEVVSPSSVTRDEVHKRRAYDLLGAREYVLFRPREGRASTLHGYRRGEDGQFEPWQPDAQGRLWSELLELYLVVRGQLVQAQTADSQLLPTPGQNAAARRQAEAARRKPKRDDNKPKRNDNRPKPHKSRPKRNDNKPRRRDSRPSKSKRGRLRLVVKPRTR